MNKLAIIPARGGSKRIPKKNIKSFLGKPIIAYSIEAAIKSGLYSEVMVSTDTLEIANIAKELGASVPFLRSKKNSDDFSTTADVIEEVLLDYKKNGKEFEYATCIYATAPFIDKNKLISSFEILSKNNFDAVFSATPFNFPIQRALKLIDNKIEMFQPEFLNSRSQDLEASYHDAGQFYTFRVKPFLKSKKIWTDNTGIVLINELEAQDIDTEIDWKLAELKYRLIND